MSTRSHFCTIGFISALALTTGVGSGGDVAPDNHPGDFPGSGTSDGTAKATEDGFRPLFNGRNLDGWVVVNTHPDTFFVRDGAIITTGHPMGFLRTDRQYENFILEFEWMHVEKVRPANSGLFVWGDPLPAVGTVYTRGIEVQVLINYPKVDWATNHGDIFSIWGARCVPDRPHPRGYERCLPSEQRVKGGGEWNHYRVTAHDGVIKLAVNGKEVSGVSKCVPRKGYLALESEGAECHFKNLRIKELPSTNPKPEEIAEVWTGHVSLFNGLDLTGWSTPKDAWKVVGGRLVAAGQAPLTSKPILPTGGELFLDWKVPAKAEGELRLTVGGKELKASNEKPGTWQRFRVTVGPRAGGSAVVIHPREGLEVMNVFAAPLPAK